MAIRVPRGQDSVPGLALDARGAGEDAADEHAGTRDGVELGPAKRPRLLLYAMYDPTTVDSAPKVRIVRLSAALAGSCDLETISGNRHDRSRAVIQWVRRRGFRRIDAIYVESASSTATLTDICFLALARMQGIPVGVYFRDAYQRFRQIYPRTRRRHRIADWLWRLTMPVVRGLASATFAPSSGLADVLGLRRPTLLPPGTDPELPNLGFSTSHEVAYVGALERADGFEMLIDAMKVVRASVPDATLVVVGPPLAGADVLPDWVRLVRAGRTELAVVLADARVCVIPRPVNRYSDLAVPIKLVDYLSFGKPVVATGARETQRILQSTGAGLISADTASGLAEELVRVLSDDALAASLAAHARAAAESPDWTWESRARRIVAALVPGPNKGAVE